MSQEQMPENAPIAPADGATPPLGGPSQGAAGAAAGQIRPAPTKTMMRNALLTGLATVALLGGFVAAPALVSGSAEAQRIAPAPIAPPGGAPNSFAPLIRRVSPAVVSISVRQKPTARGENRFDGQPNTPDEFFRRFNEGGPRRPQTALGTGFFIKAEGIVVTNHHVVEDADEITLKLADGRELKAEIVGSDEATDLAVLRVIGGGRFPYVEFDTGSMTQVGDWVIAVGNPFGLEGTATAGIVSAKGRRDFGRSAYVDFLQIDASINRGNSGGPTFDLSGRVVGVNSAILSPTGGSVGIGFAIPSDTASKVVDQLIRNGRVTRGWLGVQVQPVDKDLARSLNLPEARGAIVSGVTKDSPAERAGLKEGDIVLSFDGASISDSRDLTQKVGGALANTDARVEILREGGRRIVTVRLGERPGERQLAAAGSEEGGPPSAGPRSGPGGAQGGVVAPVLGVMVRPATTEDRSTGSTRSGGLVIDRIADDSPLADRVVPGIIIVEAGGRPVTSAAELDRAADAAKRGNGVLLLQVEDRAGNRAFVPVNLQD
jgi:serine protease Do